MFQSQYTGFIKDTNDEPISYEDRRSRIFDFEYQKYIDIKEYIIFNIYKIEDPINFNLEPYHNNVDHYNKPPKIKKN